MSDVFATSFGVLNYSGMLFNKGNTRVPFSTLIGGNRLTTNHVEFTTGQEYTTAGGTSQPSISETASLTAPDASIITRTQQTNVTQIFQESVGISYAKMANMGTLSGVNVANQTANPMNELDFQVAAKMQKIANDIEYTLLNGVYQKATTDAQANQTRGLVTAITSNVITMGNKALGIWDVAEGMKAIYDANASITGLVLLVDAVTKFQLNADAVQNGMTVVEAGRKINGINLSTIVTPLGEIHMLTVDRLPSGTAVICNPSLLHVVEQPTPGKGNFFMEELAKQGAGSKFQIYGELGLDHGPEWCHAKFTGISTTFTKPEYSKSVFIAGGKLDA